MFRMSPSRLAVVAAVLLNSVTVAKAFPPSSSWSQTTLRPSLSFSSAALAHPRIESAALLVRGGGLDGGLRRGAGGGIVGRRPSPSATELRALPSPVFVDAPLWRSIALILSANGLGAAISLVSRTQVHLDLLGTGAFALSALSPLLSGTSLLARVKVSCAAVAIWGTKLAGFLLFRAIKKGEDLRLVETLSTPSGVVGFWIVSAVWGIVCSLPHLLGTTSSLPGNPIALYAGSAMYAAGLAIETAADYQKWIFKASNPGKFCNVGLWASSQHPNFFGNLLLWAGIFVMNAPALVEPIPEGGTAWDAVWGCRRLALAALGPLFMWNLFGSQVRGELTNMKELAETKYGADPNYQNYLETVPLIVPNFFVKK